MRYSPGHKERTRAAILEAAGRVFRRRGYQGAGVDEVMREAGLTAGGFYSHFSSKEALLGEALTRAAAELDPAKRERFEGLTGREWLTAFVDDYLSTTHRDNLERGCPLAALISDGSRSGEPVKQSLEAILRDLFDTLAARGDDKFGEDRIFAVVALCVGGLGLARSVRDDALGDRILAACRELAKETCLGTKSSRSPMPDGSL
jgi:TetR/AcrR family transcriptional repressor of nem operon